MRKITSRLFTTIFLFVSAVSFAQISFNADNTSGCAPLTVTFTNTTTHPDAYRYEWYFNDGGYLVDTNSTTVTYTYNNSANYSPYVYVYDSLGNYLNYAYCDDGYIMVDGAYINAPDSTCINDNTQLCVYGYVNSVSWNFGDGGTATSTSMDGNCVNHNYVANGVYTVTAVVNTQNCGVKVVTKQIVVSGSLYPTPSVWANPNPSCPAVPVSFSTYQYVSYNWDFGDGNSSTQASPNHNYSSAGDYTATLTVTNGCGNSGSESKVVSIVNTPPFPTSSFQLQFNSPSCPNSNVYFNAPNGYDSYEWNFGDGSPLTTTTEYYTEHFYGSAIASYVVSVKITSPCGNDTTIYDTVEINNSVKFTTQSWFKLNSNAPICPNSQAYFDAPGGYNNYQWNFGDGSSTEITTSSNNEHVYSSALATYTVSVKITNSCGNDTTLYTVVEVRNDVRFSSQSWFNIYTQAPIVCPNTDVSLSVPSGYPTYEWNFGDNSSVGAYNSSYVQHNYGSTLSTYTASVKITNGCGNDTTLYTTIQVSDSVGFATANGFQLNSSASDVCPGDPVAWSAPYGYANYEWNFGDSSTAVGRSYAEHSYATVGTYTTSVKITNGCGKDTTIYSIVNINNSALFPSWMGIDVDQGVSSCPNDIIQMRFNRSGFQSYRWDFGDGDTLTSTGERVQHAYTLAGTYTVSCVVTNGCGNTKTVFETVQISNSSPVNSKISVRPMQSPVCIGDEVQFMFDYDQVNYEYVWDFGDGSAPDTTIGSGTNHKYYSLGTYTVTVNVTNGCGLSKTITTEVVVSNTSVPVLSNNGEKNWGFPTSESNGANQAGCAGDAIIFYFAGTAANNIWDFGDGNTGTATESMLVYGGDGSFPVTIIKHAYAANGNYKVKLTLENGCGNSATDSMNISIGGDQLVDGDMTTSPPPYTTCAPIEFLAFGGANYTYNFGDGSTITTTSPTVSHTFASQGVYVVTVSVTNGCGNTAIYSRSLHVDGVGGPAVSLTSSTNPTCVGGENGAASISVSGGQQPYLYSWDDVNAQTTSSVSGLKAGLYKVTVTDNIGCASVFNVSINDPAPIVLQTPTTKTACGSATGTASVSVISGGTSPYTYLWSTNETTTAISGLAVGPYSVVATDANGCKGTANITISENGGATVTLNSVTNVFCNGNSTGAININVSGSNPPYTYLWSNGATVEDPTGLPAGNYSVIVTDASSCKSMLNTTVTENLGIVVTPTVVSSPTCGNFNGSAIANVTGGSGPYTYLWDANAAAQTTQTATGLPAGTYTVTVTDNTGCTKNGVVSLSNSNAPNISANVTDVSCYGGSNGAIDITVTGGTSPYLYTWNVAPPQTNTQDINALSPGNYLVFVNDSKGCMTVRSYTISQPTQLSATASSTGATCNTNDGSATANVTGGTTPYTYSWTGGGQTTQTATGLALGTYTVTATDNKGCIATASTTISAITLPIEICMVTVDESSTHNIIYWEKPVVTNVDSFRIYREDVTNVYTRIGAVAYEDSSKYEDHGVDPNTTTKRYKISVLDNCGNESIKSNYHNTIYIVSNGNGQYTWNPAYTIENSANPVNNYLLMRDDNGTGNWAEVASTAGTQNTLTDVNYATYPNGKWRVETAWGITCTPTRASINTTRSNIKSADLVSGVDLKALSASVVVYPNPASDNVNIQLPAITKSTVLHVVNVLGEVVYSQVLNENSSVSLKQINTSDFAKGIYTISLDLNSNKVFKKLVIE